MHEQIINKSYTYANVCISRGRVRLNAPKGSMDSGCTLYWASTAFTSSPHSRSWGAKWLWGGKMERHGKTHKLQKHRSSTLSQDLPSSTHHNLIHTRAHERLKHFCSFGGHSTKPGLQLGCLNLQHPRGNEAERLPGFLQIRWHRQFGCPQSPEGIAKNCKWHVGFLLIVIFNHYCYFNCKPTSGDMVIPKFQNVLELLPVVPTCRVAASSFRLAKCSVWILALHPSAGKVWQCSNAPRCIGMLTMIPFSSAKSWCKLGFW